MTRLLLVAGQDAFRQSLAHLCDGMAGLRVTAQAGSISEGLEEAAGGFDVAVVDLRMPDGDGSDLVASLLRINPNATVLAFSRRLRTERHAKAYGAGADRVIYTGTTLTEILMVLKSLSGGKAAARPGG